MAPREPSIEDLLPASFADSTIINDVAIALDGKSYARIEDGALLIEPMPADGRIQIGNLTIEYLNGNCSVRSQGSGIGNFRNSFRQIGRGNRGVGDIIGNAARFSGPNSAVVHRGYVETNTAVQAPTLEREYDGIESLLVRNIAQDLRLEISPDAKLRVDGIMRGEPALDSRELNILGLEGTIGLPYGPGKRIIDVRSISGGVSGELGYDGSIETVSGDIVLRVTRPLIIIAQSTTGDIRVDGMERRDRRTYAPHGLKLLPALSLKTVTGDIRVNYEG